MMLYTHLSLLLAIFASLTHSFPGHQGCSILPHTDLPSIKRPLYLKDAGDKKHSLLFFRKYGLEMFAGQNLTIACPGEFNFIKNYDKQMLTAHCLHHQIFQLPTNVFHVEDLHCNNDIYGDVRKTMTFCADGALFHEIGFRLANGEFFTLIRVCFNLRREETIYTVHTITGAAFNDVEELVTYPPYQTETPNAHSVMWESYNIGSQKRMFTVLLGSEQLANNYINRRTYLTKSQHAAFGDFPYLAWKHATFYLVNVAPVWESIKVGNWFSVKRKIRELAIRKSEDFRVISGTFGVLQLVNGNYSLSEIYLSHTKRVPVPKYLWKVAVRSKTREAIGFLVLNNPFDHYVFEIDFCANICRSTGFYDQSWEIRSKGSVICCDVHQMKKFISNMPDMDFAGILIND